MEKIRIPDLKEFGFKEVFPDSTGEAINLRMQEISKSSIWH